VDQIDFDQIYAQYEQWQEDTQDDFTDWFEAIRGQLDEDAAGHLQNEIDDINDKIDIKNIDLGTVAGYTKQSAVEAAISDLNDRYPIFNIPIGHSVEGRVNLGGIGGIGSFSLRTTFAASESSKLLTFQGCFVYGMCYATIVSTEDSWNMADFYDINDHIDELNSKITVHDLGTASSLADLQSKLTTMCANNAGYVHQFQVYLSGNNFAPITEYNTIFTGSLMVATDNRYNVVIYNHGSISAFYRGVNANGTWTWDRIALTKTKTVEGTTTASGNISLDLSASSFMVIGVRVNSANAGLAQAWNNNSIWWARITNSDGTVKASTSVSMLVSYVAT
jgi:hypothetical protein